MSEEGCTAPTEKGTLPGRDMKALSQVIGWAVLSTLPFGCASQRRAQPNPPGEQPAPATSAVRHESNAPPDFESRPTTSAATECAPGALRLDGGTCTLLGQAGVYARRCSNGSWSEARVCVCSGEVRVGDAALQNKLSEELKVAGPLDAATARTQSTLDLSQAKVRSLEGLECFHGLEKLSLGRNEIEDLSPLGGLTNLRDLSAGSNRIRDIAPLASLTGLEKLQLTRNRILDLKPVESLVGLSSLGISSNCITDLTPVAGLTELENLSASFNYIEDLTPLTGMTQLKHLFLSGNRLKSIEPLAGLYELRNLFVDSTGLRDVTPLTELMRFDRIVIQRNPIDCKAQAQNIDRMKENAKLQGGEVSHDCTEKAQRAIRLGIDPLGLRKKKPRIKARDPRCKKDGTQR